MEKWMVMAKRADFIEIGKKFGIDKVTARIRSEEHTSELQSR